MVVKSRFIKAIDLACSTGQEWHSFQTWQIFIQMSVEVILEIGVRLTGGLFHSLVGSRRRIIIELHIR